MKITVSNSPTNHALQAALAASEAGMLERYVTGLYFDPRFKTTTALDSILKLAGANTSRARLHSRHLDGLPPDKISSMAWLDLVEEGWARSPLRRILPSESITFAKHELFDVITSVRYTDGCDILHAFEQCAEFSMRKAKSRGAIALLDEPVLFRGAWDRLEASERIAMGLPIEKRPPGFHRHIERKYRELELADFLLTGLDFVKRTYVDAGFPEDRVFVVPYGADVTRHVPWERHGEGFNILYIGQISWVKGLHHLLDAFEQLDIPGARLTVAGKSHREWQPYFDRRFAELGDRVNYLGSIPNAEVDEQLRRADVLAFPSFVGGIGLVVYEAMATGLPVVTTDGDVVIRDGVDGLVAGAGDVAGWVTAFERLAGDPQLRSDLGKNAVERVKSFTWEAYREGVRGVWAEIGKRERLR